MPPEKVSFRRWAALVAGVGVLAGLLTLLSFLPPDKVRFPEVVRNNYEEGIEAAALFYTESDIPLEP